EPDALELPPLELSELDTGRTAETSATPSPEAPAALMDPEFLEIFLEEAGEELEAAHEALAHWSDNPEDSNSLGRLRRAFHTLKGSGRLVGAQQVGELAWRVEDLLNRRIEGQLGQSGALRDFVSEALKVLPEVIDSDSRGCPWPIERFISNAESIARGEEPAPALIAEPSEPASTETAPELTPAPEPAPEPQSPAVTIDPDNLLAEDSELLDIFRGEAGEHLARLRAWLTESDPEQAVDEPLVRALHTLAGSGRMAGIDSIASLAKALEQRFDPLRAARAPLPNTERERLAQALAAMDARLAELPDTGEAAPSLMALVRELESAPAPLAPSPAPAPSSAPQAKATPALETPQTAPARDAPEPEAAASTSVAASAGLDPELVELFLEDARELLDQLDTLVGVWQAAPEHVEQIDAINRALHTLKGSARLAGLTPIGDLAHALESRLKLLHEAPEGIDAAALALAQRALDALAGQVEAVAAGEPLPALGTLLIDLGETESATALTAAELAPPPSTSPDSAPAISPAAPAQTAADSAPQIRVRAQLLNQLVDNAGEISIYRARLSQRNNQLGFSLGELDQTLTRLRSQLRQLEVETQRQLQQRGETPEMSSEETRAFDSLEFDRYSMLQQLSGSLAETVDDLASVKDMLGGYQREVADLLSQQARLADDLQDGLLRTRLVPFAQVVPRLQRLVRQTADSVGKSAQLEVIGPELGLDRAVLDRLVAPLEHLLRNGVDHGLEDPETRAAHGKPPTGRLMLTLRREGNDAIISLSDDGKGLDSAAIRAKAIERGMLAPEARIPDEALLQFVLEPGFTTRTQVTQISGRGVGLDVVASEIKSANGSIDLASTPGRGATFTIRLPLTLAMIEAFLVQLGETIYAIPHNSIEAVARIARDELIALYAGQEQGFQYLGQTYRVVYLGGVLDAHQMPQFGERRRLPLLLARLGEQRVALQVDSLIESQRILVKPLGPQLADVRWLSGGTILPDGRVALILDALALLRSSAIQEYSPQHAVAGSEHRMPTIMVVDDSLTVRRVTSRLLRRQGMEVVTAKDGVEALTLLDERLPDLLLLDIEMPRMDGYELTRHIRRSERLRDLPIIMITSRTGAKHREHAMALGVNRYLGKPYQESQLLDEIRLLLAERKP
ncbi:MAG: Hpt domain-containing protein, partial [Chromatiaceae bacterium]|nr:Hpt domain-containing protein [Chromatiaceae bacterium]